MYSDFVIVIETLFESLFTNFLISRFMLNVNKLVITLCHINYFCVKINILLLFSTEVVLISFSSILYTSLHLLKSERCSLTDCRVKQMFFLNLQSGTNHQVLLFQVKSLNLHNELLIIKLVALINKKSRCCFFLAFIIHSIFKNNILAIYICCSFFP